MDEVLISGAIKTGGFFSSPLGKANLIITGILFIFLIISGIYQSVGEKSLYPLFSTTVFRLVGADTKVGQLVDDIESDVRPQIPTSFFSKQLPIFLWFWLKTIFQIVTNLWFMYFFFWLCYGIFYMSNSSLILRNILLASLTFLIISLFVGMAMFTMSLGGLCLPKNDVKIFNTMLVNSYPLHGTVKLVHHIWNKDLFYKVGSWATDTGFGQAVSNIPDAPNISMNTTGGFGNGT